MNKTFVTTHSNKFVDTAPASASSFIHHSTGNGIRWGGMEEGSPPHDSAFVEFRRKVRNSELLPIVVSKLLRETRFTGRLSVVIQNGTILKSGYEEGYFTRKDEQRLT
jgi:hypothetical protein